MHRWFAAWLRAVTILGLSLLAGMLAGAHLVRAVAAEPTEADALPTVAIKDSDKAASDAVFSWLESFDSLKAGFVQQGPDGATARGTMYLEQPGKARFEYDPSVPILIVADGETLYFIDYDVDQVTPIPIEETPLALLLDGEKAARNRLEIFAAGPVQMEDALAISARDPKHPEYGTLTMLFEQDGEGALVLRAWQVLDGQGQITTVTLGEQTTDPKLAADLFKFEDPRKGPTPRRRAG